MVNFIVEIGEYGYRKSSVLCSSQLFAQVMMKLDDIIIYFDRDFIFCAENFINSVIINYRIGKGDI